MLNLGFLLRVQGSALNDDARRDQSSIMPLLRDSSATTPQALVHGLRANNALAELWLHENSLSDSGVEVRKAVQGGRIPCQHVCGACSESWSLFGL